MINFEPKFLIEDDNPDLLHQLTACMQSVAEFAKLEYFRTQSYRVHETSLENVPEEITAYNDPHPKTIDDDFGLGETQLSAAYSQLSSLRKQILVLTLLEGLPAATVAKRLNCSVDYIYKQKHRALKKLRDQFMDGGDNYGD
jgi:DNA-directed RNA polymerase specialized sigma24 family protein